MGLGDFFKKLFASEPLRVDYGSATNDRLLELWSQRSDLTEQARAELIAEAGRRQLELPMPKERAPRPPALPPLEPIVGDAIWVLPPAAVVLRTQGPRAVLCLLPTTEPSLEWVGAIERAQGLEIEAIVACNRAEKGLLPTSVIAARLRVDAEAVFLLDANLPGDRSHASWPAVPTVGKRMPKRLDRGFLRLGPMAERPTCLVASWNDGNELRVLLGADVRFEDAVSREASVVVGGLVPEMSPAAVDALLELDEVIFLPEVEGVVAWAEELAALGVNATVARWRNEEAGVGAIGRAIAANDWNAVGALVGSLSGAELETVTTGLLLQEGREGDAERVLALACERTPESGTAWFQRGAAAYVLGKEDEAIVAYRRAIEAKTPEPRAWANLSAIHGRRERWADALRAAEAAHEAMPDDAISLNHRLRALLALGRVDDARAIFTASTSLAPAQREAWRQQLDSGQPPEPGPDSFPHLAAAAARAASEFRAELPKALALLRRGVHFDPFSFDVRLQLLGALLDARLHEEIETVASAGLELASPVKERVVLQFVRGNARGALGRLDEASADLEACVALLPDFAAARADLVALSIARGRFDEAERHLAILRTSNVDPKRLEELERLFASRRPS